MIYKTLLIGAALVSAPAIAQVAATDNVPVVPVIQRLLPPNTMISVTPTSEINSGRIEVGDRFQFNVVNDVVENGVVVIPRSAVVTGTITWKTGRAIGGKSGKFEITWNTVTVGGREYRLQGVHRQEGRGNTVGAVLGSILISGRSAVLQPGNVITAMTAEPISYTATTAGLVPN